MLGKEIYFIDYENFQIGRGEIIETHQKKGEDIFCNIEVSNGFNIINDKELEGQNLSLNVNKIFFSQELFEEGIKTFLVSFTEQFLIKVDDMALTSMKTSKNLKETIRDLINYLLI